MGTMSDDANQEPAPDTASLRPGEGDVGRKVEDFTTEEWDFADKQLEDLLAERLRVLEEARADTPGTVHYGASNFPHDPVIWAADWREALPPDDPYRQIGPPIATNGTDEAYETMKAAHRAVLRALNNSD
jgi:hypothetical protein